MVSQVGGVGVDVVAAVAVAAVFDVPCGRPLLFKDICS